MRCIFRALIATTNSARSTTKIEHAIDIRPKVELVLRNLKLANAESSKSS